jgi:hypothetical protein
MQMLSNEIRPFIIKGLACFYAPSQRVGLVKKNIGA